MARSSASLEELRSLKRLWGPVDEHLVALAAEASAQLAVEESVDKIRRLQGAIEAYANARRSPAVMVDRRIAELERKKEQG